MEKVSITISGVFTYRERDYRYEVDVRPIDEKELLQMLFVQVTNPEGMKRQCYWKYKEEGLHDAIKDLCYLTSPKLENREGFKKKG